ncbi:helix-turn-helix transcriptional regulator [Paenibacillus ginsengarvi]|uniref:helix-turn-helix transcriptional regulator n=1 Tax=Paenibacillus ginsengarvi TaxID=400777 RepID=UPI001F02E925|nr:helix-turn-helix transcriptional regulator [Paenibacillus ginsengarvi]
MQLSPRQLEIVRLVKLHAPITGEQIAEMFQLSRPTIRSDLALLVMLGHLDAKPKVGYFPGQVSAEQERTAAVITSMKVKDVLSLPVNIRESATVNDAVVTLFMENVGSLIVTDESGALVGVISRKDLLKVTLGNPAASAMPVSLVMTRHPNVVTASPDDTVLDAGRKMIHHQVDGLPVVVRHPDDPERWEVVGRITKTTMTKLLVGGSGVVDV